MKGSLNPAAGSRMRKEEQKCNVGVGQKHEKPLCVADPTKRGSEQKGVSLFPRLGGALLRPLFGCSFKVFPSKHFCSWG